MSKATKSSPKPKVQSNSKSNKKAAKIKSKYSRPKALQKMEKLE